jgi:hypothetical protein
MKIIVGIIVPKATLVGVCTFTDKASNSYLLLHINKADIYTNTRNILINGLESFNPKVDFIISNITYVKVESNTKSARTHNNTTTDSVLSIALKTDIRFTIDKKGSGSL